MCLKYKLLTEENLAILSLAFVSRDSALFNVRHVFYAKEIDQLFQLIFVKKNNFQVVIRAKIEPATDTNTMRLVL